MAVAWRFDGIFKADAQTVAKELESIKCTPENIVDYAKSEDTELHKCFEWDDSIAGHKYRCIQAQKVVRSLVITREDTGEKTPIRLLHSEGNRTGEYKPIYVIVRDKDEYQSLLERAMDELRAFKRKYSCLSELEEILELID